MKKISLITFIACLVVTTSAQTLLPTRYGIKFGVNLSSLSISPKEGVKPTINSSQIGISGGACVHIPLSDKWHITPELIYSQKGASFNYDFTHDYTVNERAEYTTTNELTLAYLELNPTFSFKPSDKIALNFGPSIAYLLSESYTNTAKKISGEDATGINALLDGSYTSEDLDIGLNIGISYFITENLVFDTRISAGFMDAGVVIRPIEVTEASYTVKNRTTTFALAYLF